MKLLRSALVSVFILLPLISFTAKAQVAVDATIGETNYGYKINGGSLNFSGDHPGVGFGITYDFLQEGRVHLLADARGGVTPNAYGGDKAIVALRVSFVPAQRHLSPYFQFGGGVIQTKLPAQSSIVQAQTFTSGGIDFALGVDYRITNSVDWRVLELESGAGGNNTKATASASLATGIVYHFHPTKPKNP